MTEEQKALIIDLAVVKKHSYASIAELFGTTRGVVAGIVFRNRHPMLTGPRHKRLGTGYKRPGHYLGEHA